MRKILISNKIGIYCLKNQHNLKNIQRYNFSNLFKDKEAAEEKIFINKEESKFFI